MQKFFLMGMIVFMAFPAMAQFIDVEQINAPQTSRSIMFQPQQEEPAAVAEKPKPAPVKAKSQAPKKNAAANVSLFKPGDSKIMAVVNGDAISSADVENYARIFLLNTGVPLNNKTKPMIINKVLKTAIDEKIKNQEIEKNNMSLSGKEMSEALVHFEKNRRMPRGQLEKILKQKGINPDMFKNQLKTEILWARLVRRKVMNDSYVTQREVEDAISRSKQDMKSPKYKVSEIVIPADKAKNVSVLVDNVRHDGLFTMYAAQFSQSPSSANGGDLGWIKEGQLPKPLEDKIKTMKVGQISQPIKHQGNYYILKLDDKFVPSAKDKEITYDDMKNVLETERFESYSAKYMQNLRQKSVIEFKG